MRRRLAAAALSLSLMAGCSPAQDPQGSETSTPSAQPPGALPSADGVVDQFVKALNAFDLTKAPTVQAGADVQADLEQIFAGMDNIHPTVELDSIEYGDGETATAKLKNFYPVGMKGWRFDSTLELVHRDGAWKVDWKPSAIHPELTPESRLRHQRKLPKRAPINDSEGLALVEERTVFEVGLDKSKVDQAGWASAAAQLAGLLGIDAAAYQKKVQGGGPKQFVVAATLEQDKIPPGVADVPGGTVKETTALVSADNFAPTILGTTGPATAAQVEESKGDVFGTDTVGQSGLQARYEKQLRGVPEVRVDLVARKGTDGASAKPVKETNLYQQDSSVGTPITISLNRDLQLKAQRVLASQKGVASLVVMRPDDGALLAAADSPAAGEYPYSTFGKYAPGSTFKVVSSLAMLRGGLTPTSTVNCPATLNVNGYTIGNYTGYPASATGKITLSTALANSCNTAFAAAADKVSPEQLHAAAGSLGVGTDYDAGFTSYFGTVEPNNSPVDRAASMIGQGQITMSPLGMTSVAASVASGKTTLPWVVEGKQPASEAAPLTAEEATQLQQLMTAVVNEGSGQVLKGVMTGAKTGTAEFGPAGKQQTHAWMIAWNKDYAVAAFVEVGKSGSETAAPLIKALFS